MERADLEYMRPLLALGRELRGHDPDDPTFGLGDLPADCSLKQDDRDLEGYWVSILVMSSVSAAVDHILTMESIIAEADTITNNAPWTLVRAVLEPAAAALWILSGNTRATRQERALCAWHHDLTERGKWEQDTSWQPPKPAGKGGKARASDLLDLARSLGLRPEQVAKNLNTSDMVAHSARVVGVDPGLAVARWRESSAFAHGRTWPILSLSRVHGAMRIEGGFSGAFILDESHHRPLVELTYSILNRAVLAYAEQSEGSA